jgi:hypothetical protein
MNTAPIVKKKMNAPHQKSCLSPRIRHLPHSGSKSADNLLLARGSQPLQPPPLPIRTASVQAAIESFSLARLWTSKKFTLQSLVFFFISTDSFFTAVGQIATPFRPPLSLWVSNASRARRFCHRPQQLGSGKDLDKTIAVAYVSVVRGVREPPMTEVSSPRLFYGWWIVVAVFLNLFFAVGVVFYGFPVFYPVLAESLGFTRAQLTQGFLPGFLIVGLPFGLVAGAVIDRLGARVVILSGLGLVGTSLVLMGFMTRLWHYELLCITEVLGYVSRLQIKYS